MTPDITPPSLSSLSPTTMSAPMHYVDPTLHELKQLKQRVRSDKMMKRHISDQQDLADNAGEDLTVTWYKKYIKLFGQIDDHVKYIVPFPKPGRQFRFLDLGCCPGGFSTYVLKKNKLSTGVGVALDPAQGGHKYLIDQHLRDRYTIFFADMTRFNLSPFPVPNPYLAPLPIELVTREYDLIILDGHQLRNQNDAGGLLAISQIIIALMTTKPAGSTIVMKLSNSEIAETARIMFALDMLSSSLVAFKPYLMHREKATFYAVARGVGGGIERQGYLVHYLQHFQALWEILMSRPNQQRLLRHDLDFIATDEELASYAPRMDLLCGEVRARQRDALKSRFEALHNPL